MREEKAFSYFQTKLQTVVEQETIKNLLSAQKRIAESGNAKEVIRISRYLLGLAKQQRGNVLINAFSEGEEQRCGYPVNDLNNFDELETGGDVGAGSEY